MNRLAPALALSALLLLGCSGSDPESRLETINDLLAKDFPITTQQETDVRSFVAEGNEQIQAGNPDQAIAAFDKAIEILKYAEDAAMFNKSE